MARRQVKRRKMISIESLKMGPRSDQMLLRALLKNIRESAEAAERLLDRSSGEIEQKFEANGNSE